MGEKRVIEQVASNEVHNDDWFLKDSPTQDTSKISATNLKAILGADGTLALEEIANAIAEEYDSTHTYYNTGLVFHEGVLYQCTATSTTGTWDSTKWNVVDIKDLLDNVSTNISYLWNTISNTIAGNYDTSSTYNTGDYVIYSLKLYRCKDDGVTGAWNSSKWEEVNIPEYIDYVLANAGIVKDVKVDGTSVVNEQGEAEIEIPVKDVQVKTDSTYDSVVDASGNAKIDLSSVTAYGSVPNLPQAIATFKDGADAPMKSLKVAIVPQQEGSGDPSPTNIRPISGWSSVNVNVSGINVWDEEWANGYWNMGVYTSSTGICSKGKIPVVPNSTAYVVFPSNTTFYYTFYDKDKNYLALEGYDSVGRFYKSSSSAINVPSNAYYLTWNMSSTYGTTYNNDISINYPSTDTSYHAYNGQTYTIDLNGTRYGGTLDVVSGVLTVDRVGVDLGDLNWTYASDINRFYTDVVANIKKVDDTSKPNILCEQYITISFKDFNIVSKNDVVSLALSGKINIRDTAYSDATAFKTAMNGVYLVYELATPITYQLTPVEVKSLLGVNNIWADTGNINECIYQRDMSSTIDDIIARLEALENA